MNNNHKVDYTKKVLEVKNLRQFFKVGTGRKKILIKAVDGISFDIYKREVFGLVGESGCGKTTTGRTIIRLYNPTDGEVIYNGNVIGAGHEGFAYRIKRIRQQAKYDVMQETPFKLKSYLLREQYNFDLLDINNKIESEKVKYQQEKVSILEPKTTYKINLKNLLEKYKLARADLIYEFNQSKEEILNEGIVPIIKERKRYLKFLTKRYKDKVNFIQELKVEKYEKTEQIRIATETFNLDVEQADNRFKKRLEEAGINTYDIDFRKVKREYFFNEWKTKRTKIANLDKNLKEQLNKLKNEYILEVNKVKEKAYNQDFINTKLLEAKTNYQNMVTSLKAQKNKIVLKYKEDLAILKADFKANPDKYAANETKIAAIIEKRDFDVAEQKEKIARARTLNSYKELPEQKALRLKRLEEVKENYLKALSELEKAYEGKEKDSEYNRQLKAIKVTYKEEVKYIQSSKPSHENYLSTMQMIFQDPISSLNPRMIVSDIISEGLVIRGQRDKAKNRQKVYEILNLVGLTKDHAIRYPHEFSGGQRQRIGIARAIIANPDFIIADEPISALDVSIQAQVINLLNDLKEKLGLTILFIAHDLSVVKYFSDRIAVMFMGKIVEMGTAEEIFANPIHPYTKSLLSAIPHADPEIERNRQRILYNPMIHDYREDKPTMIEIKEGHFIYANEAELKNYKKELGL